MNAKGFDVVGVDSTGDGSPDKVLRLSDLRPGAKVRHEAQPLLASLTVEKSMPLVKLLDLFVERPEVFVLDGDQVRYILTRADIAKPPVTITALAALLGLEQILLPLAISRLGSKWFEKLPEDSRLKAQQLYNSNKANRAELGLEQCLFFDDTMALTIKARGLLRDLGWTSGNFQSLRQRMAPLRNGLAHGGTVLSKLDPMKALTTLQEIALLTERARGLSESLPSVWDLYASSIVVDADDRQLVGPEAVEWPFPGCAYVITAWNPGSRTRPDSDNEAAQSVLRGEFSDSAGLVVDVTGMSPDRTWQEPSLLVTGISRAEALACADRHGQSALFVVSEDECEVLDARTGVVRGARPRRPRSPGTAT